MLSLYSGKFFPWSLFVGHLVLEKLIKAIYTKVNQKDAPKIHNLSLLAHKSNIEVDEIRQNYLERITKFNTETRYKDHKKEFQKLCTKEFTTEQINIIKELRKWLKEELKKL